MTTISKLYTIQVVEQQLGMTYNQQIEGWLTPKQSFTIKRQLQFVRTGLPSYIHTLPSDNARELIEDISGKSQFTIRNDSSYYGGTLDNLLDSILN